MIRIGVWLGGVIVCSLYIAGCAAVVVGAGGTMLWQHGKIVSEEPKPVAKAVAAAKAVLQENLIEIKDEVAREKFVQLRGEDAEKKKVAIDLIQTGDNSTRIAIRVGMGERETARQLLLDLKDRLYQQKPVKFF